MKTIYRLDYFEPYEPECKYEELFGLGYYDSEETAIEVINSFYSVLPGFKDGERENYRITPFVIDEEFLSEEESFADLNQFYSLSHGYDIDSYTIATFIGVYSSKEKAESMLEHYRKWPIFALHNRPEIGGEFFITKCILNKKLWETGFTR